MAIEGSLADVNLADICQLLAMGRKTGCLTLTDRSDFGYVHFSEGRIVHASLLRRRDRLGELMIRNRIITREDLSMAMEKQGRESGRPLGEILVEQGSCSADELERYMTVQVEESIFHLFTWERGSFRFEPDQEPPQDGFQVSINAESLLLEAARRVDEWSQIEKRIPSFDLVFELERDPASEDAVDLTDEQRRILPLLDGERSVAEIVDESGLVEFEAARALFGLVQAGFARSLGRKDAPTAEAEDRVQTRSMEVGAAFYRAGMLEDAAREFGAVLEVEPGHTGALFQLGLVDLREGRAEEALDRFDALPDEARRGYGVQRNRALALERLGRHSQAVRALAQANQARPGDPELLLARAIVQLKAGDARAAQTSLRRYRERLEDAEPSAVYYAYAVLAAGLRGDLDGAVAVGREGLASHPDSGPLLVNTGAVLEALGERDAAEALYLRCVSTERVPAQAYKNLGDLALERGDRPGARPHYEAAVRIDPGLGSDVYAKLGSLALESEDESAAREYWRRALELSPEDDALRSRLASLAAVEG